MTIPPIPGPKALPVRPEGAPGRLSPPAGAAAARLPAVEISRRAANLRDHADMLRRLMGVVEDERSIDGSDAFEQAGRADYLAEIADPADLSAQATADRILGGIRGYIYAAFRLANPEAEQSDFDRFEADVRRGFERGLTQARDLLEGLEALTPALADDVGGTEARVREGLDAFFAAERERYTA